MPLPTDHAERIARARRALDGLSVGDAFGERFFVSPATVDVLIAQRAVPKAPWRWTDDTAMALSIVEVLDAHSGIDKDVLAARFAARYRADMMRGYGRGAHQILQEIGAGISWTHAAAQAFGGQGSMGNGAAMRVAPIGAYFADDLEAVVYHARASAEPTHAHPDAQAGAIAVAVATALATLDRANDPQALLDSVHRHTPAGPTREGLGRAKDLEASTAIADLVATLGNGASVLSSDTVPLSVFCAVHHLRDYEDALWHTVAALGDRDTTCAIVGGIVAMVGTIPDPFLRAREALA